MLGEGDIGMLNYYAPNSQLMAALSSELQPNGSIWLNWCYGGAFVANNPTYLAQVSQLFGNATIYYSTGLQATFIQGLAARVATADGGYMTGMYLNYLKYP
jgi:hypothetical protein